MPRLKRCAHGLCTSDSRYPEKSHMKGVTFFPFPNPKRDLENCVAWVNACNREDFTVSSVKPYSYVCSKHFVDPDGPTTEHPYPLIAEQLEVMNNRIRKRLRSTPPVPLPSSKPVTNANSVSTAYTKKYKNPLRRHIRSVIKDQLLSSVSSSKNGPSDSSVDDTAEQEHLVIQKQELILSTSKEDSTTLCSDPNASPCEWTHSYARKLNFLGSREPLKNFLKHSHQIFWERKGENRDVPFDGTPFMCVNELILDCKHGRNYRIKRRDKPLTSEVNRHPTAKKSHSKKFDCPSKIVVLETVRFVDYYIEQNTKFRREQTSKKLRECLKTSPENVKTETKYYIFFPNADSHQKHTTLNTVNNRIRKVLCKPVGGGKGVQRSGTVPEKADQDNSSYIVKENHSYAKQDPSKHTCGEGETTNDSCNKENVTNAVTIQHHSPELATKKEDEEPESTLVNNFEDEGTETRPVQRIHGDHTNVSLPSQSKQNSEIGTLESREGNSEVMDMTYEVLVCEGNTAAMMYNEVVRRELPRGWVASYESEELKFFRIQDDNVIMTLSTRPDFKFSLKVFGKEIDESYEMFSLIASQTWSSLDDIIMFCCLLNQWSLCRGCPEEELIHTCKSLMQGDEYQIVWQTSCLHSKSCKFLLLPGTRGLSETCRVLRKQLQAAVHWRRKRENKDFFHPKTNLRYLPPAEVQKLVKKQKDTIALCYQKIARLKGRLEKRAKKSLLEDSDDSLGEFSDSAWSDVL